ncbi:sugar phosphate isomerase/epimerase family protein [Staphylospora marina]|uniref:sugar phosphate isomerase/epimerase family protein n=1 Tax=Staphylospora marina TaxID=2490858 RepID=UPI000F5BAC0C|nr:sugar phosphate isomerase/epimerase family protein [Staphylospora marina]
MPIRVSCHLITWGEAFRQALTEAAGLGFGAVEPLTHHALQYEKDVAAFRELLDEHGLVLSGLYAAGRFSDSFKRSDVIAYNVRVARFLRECGSNRLVLGPEGPRPESGMTREMLKAAAETINETAKRCMELGVKACIHPHLWTEIQDEWELDAIMEWTDPECVFLCPDTAHMAKAGMDPLAVMQRYKDRIAYLHLKDASLGAGTADGEEGTVFCELGRGDIRLKEIMDFLKETDYDGWVTVEIDRSLSTPLQSLTVCRDYLQEKLGIPVQG